MMKNPVFWLCQVVSLSFGGLLASVTHGDYPPAIFITICMSACLTILLLLDK